VEEKKERAVDSSRRNILKGSAAFIAGSIAGSITTSYAAQAPKCVPAPPLPWKWTKLDPLEAGTRAYQAYLKNKG